MIQLSHASWAPNEWAGQNNLAAEEDCICHAPVALPAYSIVALGANDANLFADGLTIPDKSFEAAVPVFLAKGVL